jgi:hypothetical protein
VPAPDLIANPCGDGYKGWVGLGGTL